jgi:hypothetical protein
MNAKAKRHPAFLQSGTNAYVVWYDGLGRWFGGLFQRFDPQCALIAL